jgi:hypothetical protein
MFKLADTAANSGISSELVPRASSKASVKPFSQESNGSLKTRLNSKEESKINS